MVKAYDLNKDRLIEFNEFVKWLIEIDIKNMFDKIDLDKSTYSFMTKFINLSYLQPRAHSQRSHFAYCPVFVVM